MAGLREIMPGIWRWTWFSEEKGMDFNGYAARFAEGLTLIDPAYAGAATWNELETLGKPVRILLTNKDHERASGELRRRFHIPVCIHEADAPLLSAKPEETFKDAAILPGGLETVRFSGLKSPGECAFLWRARRVIFVGDAVTGDPAGSIGLVKKHQGRPEILSELRKLLPLEFDALLVGDGEPHLHGGREALGRFLHETPSETSAPAGS